MTGVATVNLDQDTGNTLERSEVIGTAIPSGIVIAIIRGRSAGYIGVRDSILEENIGEARMTKNVLETDLLKGFHRYHWRIRLENPVTGLTAISSAVFP